MVEVHSILDVIAEIDSRLIPHSPEMSSALIAPINSAPSSWMRTEAYMSHGIRYARFRWGKGSESWGYVHIAGGSCSSELVQLRRRAVDQLIGSRASLDQILALLRIWENARAGRKKRV